MKLRRNDKVIVLAGKEKNMVALVKEAYPKLSKLIVEGVNVVKKAKKQTSAEEKVSGHDHKEMPIDACKVAIYNPDTKKPDRVGYKFLETGKMGKKKVRIFKKTGSYLPGEVTESVK